MKLTTTARTLLIAAGVSVATAGLTAATVLSFSSPSRPTADTCVGSDLDGGFALPTGVRNVASVGSIDFTEAAESTINGVVSIKSYATPQMRQSSRCFLAKLIYAFHGTAMHERQLLQF